MDAKRRGVDYLLKRLKICKTVTYHRNGSRTEAVVHDFALRDKSGALEMLGKHWDIWKDSMDPDEVFERLLGIPRNLIPAKLDDSVNLQLNRSGTYVVPGADEEEEVEE